MTTIQVTHVIAEPIRGMDWKLKYKPVAISKIALASYLAYGNRDWSLSDFDALGAFADKHGWSIELGGDEPDFETLFSGFCDQVNNALLIIDNALTTIDRLA